MSCKKKRYPDMKTARQALKDKAPDGSKKPFRAYHCQECGHYHLTSKKGRYPITITQQIAKKIKRLAKQLSPKQISDKLGLAYLTVYKHMQAKGIIHVKQKNKRSTDGEEKAYFDWADYQDYIF